MTIERHKTSADTKTIAATTCRIPFRLCHENIQNARKN